MPELGWRVLAEGLRFPEGPCFAPDGMLWWVEIEGGRLGRIEGGRAIHVEVGGRPNGAAFDAAGHLWFCDQGRGEIRRHSPRSGLTECMADACEGRPLGKPNDLCFDRAGNLLFTCSNDARTEPVGYVCCRAPDGAVTRIADGLRFPNGLALRPDGATLYVAETYRRRVLAGAWDAGACRLAALAPWAEAGGPIGPDGLAFDDRGTLHAAIFGQGRIASFAPDGTPGPTVACVGPRPTNLAFDTAGELGLVVTETETGTIAARPWRRPARVLFPGFPDPDNQRRRTA